MPCGLALEAEQGLRVFDGMDAEMVFCGHAGIIMAK